MSGCISNMGMGPLGNGNIVFKRKFRWTFTIYTNSGTVPPSIVKVSARPSLTIEDTEINYLNAKMWIPGKASWETITVTYYDVSAGGPAGAGVLAPDGGGGNFAKAAISPTIDLFNWLASVYDFTNPTGCCMSSSKNCYAGRASLDLYDGCGTVMESWILGNMWPSAINFGELDYSSSEECTIELTLRYSEVQYIPGCGGGTINPRCCGCN